MLQELFQIDPLEQLVTIYWIGCLHVSRQFGHGARLRLKAKSISRQSSKVYIINKRCEFRIIDTANDPQTTSRNSSVLTRR